MRYISVVNQSTVVKDEDVVDAIIAIQHQINNDVAPVWDLEEVKMYLQPKTDVTPKGNFEMVILDDSDQAGALGYHETASNGEPIGFVFAKTTMDAGDNWTVTFSHETIEMVVDPYINSVTEVDNTDGTIQFYATEPGDPVEDDQFGYHITNPSDGKIILVSDFIFPHWFIPTVSGWPLDFKGHVTKPLELLPNGYISVLQTNSSWGQVSAKTMNEKAARQAIPQPYHRRFRRLIPRKDWKKSEL